MSRYDEAVEMAAGALMRGEDANWELARLTYENTLSPGNVKAQVENGKVSMEQWCTDVQRVSGRQFSPVGAGRRYKATWERFGRAGAARPPWSEAYETVNPSESRNERLAPLHARSAIEHGTTETKVEFARKLLAEPEVAGHLHEEITSHVAADPKLTTDVIRKRQDAAGIREVQPRPQRDYDAMVEQFVNLGTMIAAAESSKKWSPSERSEALLYFMAQILGERRTPTGDMDDLVNQKLEDLFSEVEAYANSEAS